MQVSRNLIPETQRWRAHILSVMERSGDWVSFAELVRGQDDARGEVAITPDARPNTVIWTDMSEPFVAAVRLLVHADIVRFAPGRSLAYIIDGAFLSLPIARRSGKQDFKKPRWIPTFLRPGKNWSTVAPELANLVT